eukprot:7636-Eustigmatos_ZCMA.PRE.1
MVMTCAGSGSCIITIFCLGPSLGLTVNGTAHGRKGSTTVVSADRCAATSMSVGKPSEAINLLPPSCTNLRSEL